MRKTAADWLAYSDDELALELAKVLDENWDKHRWKYGWTPNCSYPNWVKCYKCDSYIEGETYGDRKRLVAEAAPCPVPDRIKLDWNTAMEWARKAEAHAFNESIEDVFSATGRFREMSVRWWMQTEAQPKHYLIAAVMAKADAI